MTLGSRMNVLEISVFGFVGTFFHHKPYYDMYVYLHIYITNYIFTITCLLWWARRPK